MTAATPAVRDGRPSLIRNKRNSRVSRMSVVVLDDLGEPRRALVKQCDMSEKMQQQAVNCAMFALDKYDDYQDVAAFMKKEFDKRYRPYWHCVVGRSFGCYVTNEIKHFAFFYIGNMAILLFKGG